MTVILTRITIKIINHRSEHGRWDVQLFLCSLPPRCPSLCLFSHITPFFVQQPSLLDSIRFIAFPPFFFLSSLGVLEFPRPRFRRIFFTRAYMIWHQQISSIRQPLSFLYHATLVNRFYRLSLIKAIFVPKRSLLDSSLSILYPSHFLLSFLNGFYFPRLRCRRTFFTSAYTIWYQQRMFGVPIASLSQQQVLLAF